VYSHTDRSGHTRRNKPQRALQVNGVAEFVWKKLRRRNGGIKQAMENHLCLSSEAGKSSLPQSRLRHSSGAKGERGTLRGRMLF